VPQRSGLVEDPKLINPSIIPFTFGTVPIADMHVLVRVSAAYEARGGADLKRWLAAERYLYLQLTKEILLACTTYILRLDHLGLGE
jgi:hypothetical protein